MSTMTSSPIAPVRNVSKRSAAHVVAPGGGRAYWAMGDRLTFKLGPEHTAGAFSMAEALVAPGGGPPPHVHSREDEMFYVLAGHMQFVLGDQLLEGLPGDAFFLPRGVTHAFKNVAPHPARALVFATPCGFESFIPEFGVPAETSPEAPPITPELIDRLVAACGRYGLEMKFDHQPRAASSPRPAARRYKPLWVLGEHVDMKLASADTNGSLNLATLTSRPGGGPPLHAHTDCDELFFVERGRYEFRLDQRTIIGEAGTTVYVPSGTMHAFRNVGSTDARLLTIHTPGGFEHFYTEMGTGTDPTRPPTDPLDLQRVNAVMTKHHMVVAAE